MLPQTVNQANLNCRVIVFIEACVSVGQRLDLWSVHRKVQSRNYCPHSRPTIFFFVSFSLPQLVLSSTFELLAEQIYHTLDRGWFEAVTSRYDSCSDNQPAMHLQTEVRESEMNALPLSLCQQMVCAVLVVGVVAWIVWWGDCAGWAHHHHFAALAVFWGGMKELFIAFWLFNEVKILAFRRVKWLKTDLNLRQQRPAKTKVTHGNTSAKSVTTKLMASRQVLWHFRLDTIHAWSSKSESYCLQRPEEFAAWRPASHALLHCKTTGPSHGKKEWVGPSENQLGV